MNDKVSKCCGAEVCNIGKWNQHCSKCGNICRAITNPTPTEILWVCPSAQDCVSVACELRKPHTHVDGHCIVGEHQLCEPKCIEYHPKPEPKEVESCRDCYYDKNGCPVDSGLVKVEFGEHCPAFTLTPHPSSPKEQKEAKNESEVATDKLSIEIKTYLANFYIGNRSCEQCTETIRKLILAREQSAYEKGVREERERIIKSIESYNKQYHSPSHNAYGEDENLDSRSSMNEAIRIIKGA